jgi:hypothetical protein
MTAISTAATVVAAPDAVSAEVNGECVLLNVATGTYHGMNAVGARVYDLVETARPVGEVVAAVGAEFDVDPATADRDVRAFLADLVAAGLADLVDPDAEDDGGAAR